MKKSVTRKAIFLMSIIFLILISSFIYVNSLSSINNSLSQLRVTQEHPFYLNGEWVAAKDLKVGDTFKTIDGKTAKIKKIKLIEEKESFYVYNLEVPIYTNFVVGPHGIIVHNSNVPQKRTSFSGERKELSEVYRMNDNDRIAYTESRIGELSISEKEAILYAHHRLSSVSEKARFLESTGFGRIERDIILSEGICGTRIPKIIGTATGTDLVTGAKRQTILYDSVDSTNINKVFTNELEHIHPDYVGTKSVAYVDNNGKTKVAFFSESENTHHVHVGASLAEGDGWDPKITQAFYEGNFNGVPQSRNILQRQFGFDYLLDKKTGQIIQIRMDSRITGAQRHYGVKFEREQIESVVLKMLEDIDPQLLAPKYRDLKWMDDPVLLEMMMPSYLFNIILSLPFIIS
jgi:hypothetical protein